MHELSIIQSILETTADLMRDRQETQRVETVELQIGALAGVEIRTLEFLWPAAVGDTFLADAELRIDRVGGMAECSDCGTGFAVQSYFDPCPLCGSHLLNVKQGEELRIKSLSLVDHTQPIPVPV